MPRPDDYFNALLRRLHQSSQTDFVQLLREAATAHPSDPRPLLLLAAEYAETQQMDLAEACYIAALQLAPDFHIARFQLGLLQFSSARPAAAQATFAPLDRLPATHPLRLFKNAFDCLALDQLAQARDWLQQGIANNHDNAPLNQDMQKIIRQLDLLDADVSRLPVAGPTVETPAAPAPEEHFLVSAYRNLH